MRRRYPLALLLVLAATMVLTAAFASSALALSTFDQAEQGIGPCNLCHTQATVHAVSAHKPMVDGGQCSSCHQPQPSKCGACHGGVTAIIGKTTHVAEGCNSAPGCHGVPLPAPTITSFTPTSGPVGTTVTVTGTNFTGVTAVKFNGVAATTFSATNATTITAKVPTGATTGTIQVTTPGGSVTSAGTFTVTVPAPTIASFLPASGPVGTTVTLTGTGFTGVTAVKFNGIAATTFGAASATKITAKVPTGATTGTIEVTTPGGSVTSATPFTVLIKESIGLKLNGKTTTVAILLGRSVKATGVITPTLTVPQVVKLTVQKWRPATRRWVAVTTLSTIKVTGAYSKTYKPASRGTFQMRAVLAKTDVHTLATSVWRKFIVK